MAGWVHMKVELIKGGMAKYGIKNPIFKPSPIVPTYKDYLIFEGISVDESGKQHYLDVNIAYKQACLNAINYLTKFGRSEEHTSELQSLMRISYAVFCLKKKTNTNHTTTQQYLITN